MMILTFWALRAAFPHFLWPPPSKEQLLPSVHNGDGVCGVFMCEDLRVICLRVVGEEGCPHHTCRIRTVCEDRTVKVMRF